jgi:hypothetical protein
VKRAVAAALLVAGARVAAADTTGDGSDAAATESGSTAADDSGFVGEAIPTHLDIDDCAPNPPGASRGELVAKGAEFYERGEQLYLQGDYRGAVHELVSSYCTLPYYSILKDIGQAYERALDFELAIAYLRRYRRDIPDNAQRSSPCAADPQDDKKNITSRISVLLALDANVSIDTNVKDAEITLENSGRVIGRAKSGESFFVRGGRKYEMTIASPGYEAVHQEVRAVIGKPLTMYVPLQREHGRLTVRAQPADAKIYLDTRFLGIGEASLPVEAQTYGLHVEAPDYQPSDEPIAILPNAETDRMIELEPLPQTGRRQLLAYAGIAGAAVGAAFGRGINDQSSGAGLLIGTGIALAGTYFYADDRIALGPSSLTITSSLIGAVAANDLGLIATNTEGVETTELAGIGAIVGAAAGYYAGAQTKITAGDAAVVNSGALWGGIAGHLFGAVFQDGGKLTGGLGMTGLAMGTTAGILLARTYSVSRKHAALIDVGGAIGILAGVAADNVIFNQTGNNIGPNAQASAEQQERTADFALGGLAVGLVAAGVLTRTMDVPKLPTIAVGHATGSDGKSIATVGFGGAW